MRQTFYYDTNKRQVVSELRNDAIEVVVKEVGELDDIVVETYDIFDKLGNQYRLNYHYSSSLDKYATRELREFMRSRIIESELDKVGGMSNMASVKLVRLTVPNDYELSDCFFCFMGYG